MIVLDRKDAKKVIRFFFFLYMCSIMAHRRGFGFDLLFSRFSFIALLGVFVIFALLNPSFMQVRSAGYFVGLFLFSSFYFLSFLWARNLTIWADTGIIKALVKSLITLFIIEATTDDLFDCKAYLKAFLLAIFYMMICLAIATPLASWGTERVGAAMSLNSNTIGIWCANAFLIAVYFATEKGRLHSGYMVVAALAVVLAFFSGSRKAFAIVILGFLIFWCCKEKGMRALLNGVAVLVAGFGIVYLVMTNEKLYHVLGRRLESALTFLLSGERINGDISSVERDFYRDYAAQMVLKRPLLGYGGNGFVAEMHRIHYQHVAYSHCNYLELLATLGVVGTILYYQIQGRMAIKTVRMMVEPSCQNREILSLVLSLVLTNLAAEYFRVSYYSVETHAMIAILFAVVHCYSAGGKKRDEDFAGT